MSFFPESVSDLLGELRDRYETREPGPCPVCGSKRTAAEVDSSGTTYVCEEANDKWKDEGLPFESEAMDHRKRSRTKIRCGDWRVIMLLEAIDDLDEADRHHVLSKVEDRLADFLAEHEEARAA